MKQNKIIKVFSFLLVVTLLYAGIFYMPVEAGASDIIIDSSTYVEGLDNSVWNNPDNDITIKQNAIVFENTSSEFTRVITKTAVKATAEMEELVKAEATMQFTSLPKDETFAIALGVKKIESLQGDIGNVEVGFTNNGGLNASVIYYNEDGDAEVLVGAKKCGSLTGKNSVEVVVTTSKMLTLTVNGKKICAVELPVSGEGRIGFVQTGSCGTRLSNIKIVSHLYDSPENCDIYEDFENGDFNANLITAKMRGASYVCWPSGTAIEEYNGSKVFKTTNAGETYIGTKYTYSNFEISFDVPFLQRQNVLDEDGNQVTAMSNRFGISYGGTASDFDYTGYTDAVTDVIWFNTNSTIASMKTAQTVNVAALGYPFFRKDCDKGFSIKMTMQDSVVTVYMKWMDENQYKEVFKYQTSSMTPNGYLHIWSDGPSNIAIDNLKIVNKDLSPKLTNVEFKTSVIDGPGDFDYQPMKKEYAPVQEEKGFNWYLILPIVAGVCVVTLGAVIGITTMKNKKRKVVDNHEV